MTLVAFGVSIDSAGDCGGGTFDFELWGTSSSTDDNNYALVAQVEGNSGETANDNNLNIDVDGNQYTLWGLENNCGNDINDFNAIFYIKWRHDQP